MAEIIYLHKQRSGPKPKERSFVPMGRDATILMFTGVRYERQKTSDRVRKPRSKRVTSR